jgi:hypothetical protein
VYIYLHLGLTLFKVFWKQRRLLLFVVAFADSRDMTTPSSSTSYANALRGAPGPRAPVQALPLHHAPFFQEKTTYVNLRGAAVDYTQKERDSFLKDDLGLRTEDVLNIFLDPSTLQLHLTLATPVPEFIDPVFTKTRPKRSFSVIQNERFGLVFAKTGSIISGTALFAEILGRLFSGVQ